MVHKCMPQEEADAPTCNSNAKTPPFLEKNMQRRVCHELTEAVCKQHEHNITATYETYFAKLQACKSREC